VARQNKITRRHDNHNIRQHKHKREAQKTSKITVEKQKQKDKDKGSTKATTSTIDITIVTNDHFVTFVLKRRLEKTTRQTTTIRKTFYQYLEVRSLLWLSLFFVVGCENW
jgi:hypothetical protein